MPKLSPNALGSLYMTIGSLGYVVNDGAVRRITEDGPDVYQVLFLRSCGLVAVFAVLAWFRDELPRRSHLEGPLLTRVAAEVISSALFFAAVVQMEFANVQAILQVVPLAVTFAAAILLRERVAPRQYLAIVVGFIGVVILIRPATDGFSAWSLVALASTVFLVAREFATRKVGRSTPAVTVALATAVGLAALTGGLSVIIGWQSLTATGWGFMAVSIATLTVGYLFTIETVRVGDLSVSAPFRYSILLGAVVIGYLMFDEVPDELTVIGCIVIALSGLYSLRLDRRRAAAM